MIDAGGSRPFWTLHFKDALERAKMLADCGIAWFEEPLAADDMEGYVRLTDSSPVKISHCEVLTRRQSFVPYSTRRAMDIVQPDVAKVGGLSEIRRIARPSLMMSPNATFRPVGPQATGPPVHPHWLANRPKNPAPAAIASDSQPVDHPIAPRLSDSPRPTRDLPPTASGMRKGAMGESSFRRGDISVSKIVV